jgi:DNA polymerase zeta
MRTHTNLELLEEVDIVTKTALVRHLYATPPTVSPVSCSEFARVFGVDFFSVLTRGSQFKVESFMFRIAKPESFILISPSKEDVGFLNVRSKTLL